MSGSDDAERSSKTLGMGRRILRRDFMNSTLLASGAALLGGLTPRQLLAKEEWTGYAGVGDYARSNGNTYETLQASARFQQRAVHREVFIRH